MASHISLRDPAGHLVRSGGRLFRIVTRHGTANARACLDSEVVRRWQAAGRFISAVEVAATDPARAPFAEAASIVLEHRIVAFPTYPYEWSPMMLRTAGLHTLDLAMELLEENRGLKDATPFNVLFEGARPVFVDALSVEERDPCDPVWMAYGQFVRTFILPLIASRYLGWSLRRAFTGARDGLTPEELHRTLRMWHLLRPDVFGFVSGPTLLSRFNTPRYSAPRVDEQRAKFALKSVLRHLRRALIRVSDFQNASRWSNYRDPHVHAPSYHATRIALVEQILRQFQPTTVLDIGTNDGTFAAVAASAGANVTAIDRDEAVVDDAFRRTSVAGDAVTSLVVDLTDPTPATGWRNTERASFFERAGNGFDCVLCLSVLHHLIVGDWLPLIAVVELMATLTNSVLIAEFVPPEDPYCVSLAAGRTIDPARWSIEAFETAVVEHFAIRERHPAGDSGRIVYVLIRRGA